MIIVKPKDHWLLKEPSEKGYWGFVRCKEDYEKEKSLVHQQIEDLIENLRKEGMKIEFLPELEIQSKNNVLKEMEELKKADVNTLLPIFPLGWTGGLENERDPAYGDLAYALVAASNYAIFFDKFKPNIYAGTLFTPRVYQTLKLHGLKDKVFLAEGDEEKLKIVLRGIYALTKLSSAKLVSVGPMNDAFGGWFSFKKGKEIFGYRAQFYTYDEFVKDFKASLEDESKSKEARKVAEDFTSKATEVIEPTKDKLLRAGIYYLVLKKYLKENGADWVTVNCLSELLKKTKSTPCMAFSIFNDSGVVASCEADPAAMVLHYLMQYISGKPAFFQNPTVNEKDETLILAHCTSPTKLLGFDKPNFPYQVRTHHESNFGAAPKPTFEEGEVTVAGLSADLDKMLIVKGRVVGTPDRRICRSQIEVKVNDASKILQNFQGSHWILTYGDCSKELKVICKAKGIECCVA